MKPKNVLGSFFLPPTTANYLLFSMAEQPSTSTPTPVTESNGQVNGNASTTKKGSVLSRVE